MSFYNKFIPTYFYLKIENIDYLKLKEQGVKSLFFDLDNTLIAYDQNVISKDTYEFIKNLEKDFNVVIISNSKSHRVIPAVYDLKYVYFAKKPFKFGIHKAIKMVSSSKDEVVLIGDQIITDIFGANRAKIKSILVKPIKKSSDRKITKFNRGIANMILKGVKRKYPKAYEELIKPYED